MPSVVLPPLPHCPSRPGSPLQGQLRWWWLPMAFGFIPRGFPHFSSMLLLTLDLPPLSLNRHFTVVVFRRKPQKTADEGDRKRPQMANTAQILSPRANHLVPRRLPLRSARGPGCRGFPIPWPASSASLVEGFARTPAISPGKSWEYCEIVFKPLFVPCFLKLFSDHTGFLTVQQLSLSK